MHSRIAIFTVFFVAICLLMGCEDVSHQSAPAENSSEEMPAGEEVPAGEEMSAGEVRDQAGSIFDRDIEEEQDLSISSAGEESADAEMADVSTPRLSLNLDSPTEGLRYETNDDITVRGSLSVEGASLEFVAVEAIFDEAESLPVLLDRESGALSTVISAPNPGEHSISIRAAISPNVRVEETRRFSVNCPMMNDFDEPLDPTQWLAKGPAIRDERGWLELTQNQLNTRGAIFWAGSPVRAGDLDLRFAFSTSKCEEPGPCEINRIDAGGGFSINFWDVRPQELESLWEVTRGLGHAIPQVLIDERMMSRAESLHIVFDTYSNTCTPCGVQSDYDGCGNQHEEPTTVNHVSLIFNGHKALHGEPDESGSYCHLGPVSEEYSDRWSAFPELDDGLWHNAHLTIMGNQIRLTMDDQELINAELPELRFKGGILSISAGSGVNGNFHRVDRLQINNQCR